MSEPFVGQITMFAGNFAPRGWAFCDGQLMAVNQNDALFSLYGTIYGGDGRTTFGLPDLRGRTPIHAGPGPGLTNHRLGSKGGQETVTLTTSEMPSHDHAFNASNDIATIHEAAGKVFAVAPANFYEDQERNVNLNTGSITNTGGNRSHNNIMPYLCIHFIVALFGVYPSRS